MSGDAVRAFTDALAAVGLHPKSLIADGGLHRCAANGDKVGKQSGWYVLHLDGLPAGVYGDWRTGHSERWQHDNGRPIDEATRERLAKAVAKATAQRERERAKSRLAAQQVARDRWRRAVPAEVAHPYLHRKGVGVHGLRQLGDRLLVPMRDSSGTLWAVQSITPEGEKRFLRGARKRGLYHAIGPQVESVLCIAEGYATAASILEATGYPVAVAFDCGNLLPVARTLRGKFPRARFIVCADNDMATAERTGRNPGIEAATLAAKAVGGVVVSPSDFPATTGKDMSHARTTASACAA
jgi:putative DNA primase/helicase